MPNANGINICIDLRPLETSNKFRGFGYYIYNLVNALLAIDKKNNYLFIVYSKENPIYKEHHDRNSTSFITINKPKFRPRFWWLVDQFVLNNLVRKTSPDVFVSLDMAVPLLLVAQKRIKLISTIYDLIPLAMAKEYNFPIDKTLEFRTKYFAAAKCNRILTISNYSKSDIEKYLHVSDHKITVIYGAVSRDFKPFSSSQNQSIRQKYTRGKKYFMVIGDFYGIDPRKNYLLTTNSFAQVIKKYKDLSDYVLLFVGQSGGTFSEYSKIISEAEKLSIRDKVIFTGFVSQEELPMVYSGAEAMLYPSNYEGFGLPILQAMACGCPVVTTTSTSIPEVAGSAAVMINSQKPEDLVLALRKITTDRSKLVAAGYKNIKRFSWEKCAYRTLRSVQNTIKNGK